MKNLLIGILIVICKTVAAQNPERSILDGPDYGPVTIQFVNHTGYRIDTLILGGILYWSLEKDSATRFITTPNYLDNELVYGNIQGIILDRVNWIWHCRGVPYRYQNMTLIVEIVLIESPFTECKYRMVSKILEVIPTGENN